MLKIITNNNNNFKMSASSLPTSAPAVLPPIKAVLGEPFLNGLSYEKSALPSHQSGFISGSHQQMLQTESPPLRTGFYGSNISLKPPTNNLPPSHHRNL